MLRFWKDFIVNFDLYNWLEDDDECNGVVLDDFIYMDVMVFGMGSCCFQIIFQVKNIMEGWELYDQLSFLGFIMFVLIVVIFVYKGFLVNIDVWWN